MAPVMVLTPKPYQVDQVKIQNGLEWTLTLRSRLEPMRKFVSTLRQHYDGVIAFIDTRLTNAVAEGINRIVKIVKNRASGFRTLSAFEDIIYLTVGDVDIPAQIPAKFRTL